MRIPHARKALPALLCSAILLTGCTNTGEAESSSEDASAASAETQVQEEADGAASGNAAAEVPNVDAPDPELPVTFTGDDEQEITVESLERVLVLDDATIEVFDALGHVDLVGIAPEDSAYADLLGDAERITTSGSGALTVEGVVALQPTLVIGTNMKRHADLISGLQDAGVAATLINRSQDAPEIITKTASLIGVADAGKELAKQVTDTINAAEEKAGDIPDAEHRRVMVLSSSGAGDSGNTTGAGSDTPADQVVTYAGGINTGAESGLDRYQSITAEGLAAAQPEVIIVAESEIEDLGGEEGIWDYVAGLKGTPAAENKELIVMPDAQIKTAGVHTGIGVANLQAQLYPELGA